MSDFGGEPATPVELDILHDAGSILERIQPGIVLALGNIAANGADPESRAYLERLLELSANIHQTLSRIVDTAVAIELIKAEPEPEPATPAEEPDVIASEPEPATEPQTDESSEKTAQEAVDTPLTEPGAETPAKLRLRKQKVKKDAAELVQIPLTAAEEALLVFARTGEAFRLEEIRRDLKTFATLSRDEYELFKAQFETTQAKIVAHLRREGYYAAWHRTGKARGTRYHLSIRFDGREAFTENPVAAEVGEPESVSPVTEDEVIERLLNHIGELEQAGGPQNRRALTTHLAGYMNTTPEHARLMLDQLCAGGKLYTVDRKRGRTMLSTKAPGPKVIDLSSAETAAANGDEPEDLDSPEADPTFQEVDAQVAIAVFDALAGLKHITDGIPMSTLIKRPEFSRLKLDEEELRKAVRRVASSGWLKLNRTRPTRSPHSRKHEVLMVHFASQQHKRQWKDTRSQVITLLNAKVGKTEADPIFVS